MPASRNRRPRCDNPGCRRPGPDARVPGRALHRADRPGHPDVPAPLVPGGRAAAPCRVDRLAPRCRCRKPRPPGRHESGDRGGEQVSTSWNSLPGLRPSFTCCISTTLTGARCSITSDEPATSISASSSTARVTPAVLRPAAHLSKASASWWHGPGQPRRALSGRSKGGVRSTTARCALAGLLPHPDRCQICGVAGSVKVPRGKFSVCEKFSVWRGLDGFCLTRTIGRRDEGALVPLPFFSHPARGYALVSLPRTGLVSQRPGGHR